MAGRLWVAQLLISAKTRDKIVGDHGITEDEVRVAVECAERLDFVWDVDLERGERAIVSTTIRSRPVLVVLYDAEHPMGDVYWLGSCYFVDT